MVTVAQSKDSRIPITFSIRSPPQSGDRQHGENYWNESMPPQGAGWASSFQRLLLWLVLLEDGSRVKVAILPSDEGMPWDDKQWMFIGSAKQAILWAANVVPMK